MRKKEACEKTHMKTERKLDKKTKKLIKETGEVGILSFSYNILM